MTFDVDGPATGARWGQEPNGGIMTQPGTYTGADGREYRWKLSVDGKSHYHVNGAGNGENIHDWPAAKAALDALLEAESEEWVEIAGGFYRISLDGKRVQQQYNHVAGGRGYDDLAEEEASRIPQVQSYRKGREVALEAEATKLQEAISALESARELVEAVERASDLLCRIIARPSEGRQLKRIVVLAKALRGKL